MTALQHGALRYRLYYNTALEGVVGTAKQTLCKGTAEMPIHRSYCALAGASMSWLKHVLIFSGLWINTGQIIQAPTSHTLGRLPTSMPCTMKASVQLADIEESIAWSDS